MRQLVGADVGHDHVGQDQVHVARLPVQLAQGLIAGAGHQHPVGPLAKDARRELPDAVLVLDHQDGPTTAASLGSEGRGWRDLDRRLDLGAGTW